MAKAAKKKPVILITNDDGITAPGIQNLVEAVKDLGKIIVVAPDKPQSGMGHAITIGNPLRLHPVNTFKDIEAWQCTARVHCSFEEGQIAGQKRVQAIRKARSQNLVSLRISAIRNVVLNIEKLHSELHRMMALGVVQVFIDLKSILGTGGRQTTHPFIQVIKTRQLSLDSGKVRAALEVQRRCISQRRIVGLGY